MNSSGLDQPAREARDTAHAAAPAPPTQWATRLRRHLTLAFVAKLAFLALLSILFFSSSQRPHIDASRVANHLLSPR
jgi:hypothetical protein